MISRLTVFAATFAVLATASLAFAVNLHTATLAETVPVLDAAMSTRPTTVRVIQLPRVTIVAKRAHANAL